ncbi:hypothetical protein PAECIP112173_00403 [Paenibacillus sp. JJ-100]|uniref:plantaricin C family lantibiotic n=1 Tax=Paenibacillus sp. JJ-100 TaxID=2974896 RepID=UPI0022FF7A9A|nr:plantaricin C family lantibiotic [Paenibacillus sp. JJ-100]CAI6024918.1 hypothetical protein PAECIP112173_00403 [Paenibacillus sp. JJ-100]
MQWKNQVENLKLDTSNPVGSVLSELTDTEMETVAGGDYPHLPSLTKNCSIFTILSGCSW